jgi:hypothetical protein
MSVFLALTREIKGRAACLFSCFAKPDQNPTDAYFLGSKTQIVELNVCLSTFRKRVTTKTPCLGLYFQMFA